MPDIFVVDRLINKPIRLPLPDKDLDIKPGDKVVYKYEDKDNQLIGTCLGYRCDTIKTGTFVRAFSELDDKQFEHHLKKSKDLFKLFKKEFKSSFPESTPITARLDLSGKQVYFYFYAETRFDFKQFLGEFRKKVGMNFFLFQVGARDRIRFSHGVEQIFGTCGFELCCKTGKCPLPTVDSDNIGLQNLENRGIEKLKGRCGKLKCCLNYERHVYEDQVKHYPKKGDEFKYKGRLLKSFGFNIMTEEIIAKDEAKDENMKVKVKDIDPKSIIRHNVKSEEEIALEEEQKRMKD